MLKIASFKQLTFIFFLLTFSQSAFSETIKLTICEWQGYIMPWHKEFQQYAKERGLEVELRLYPEYLSSPEQIFNLARGKLCDVITPTHNYFSQRHNQLFRSLLPIDVTRIPNYKHVFLALKNLKYKEFEGNSYAIPLLGGSYGLAYNADKVNAPSSFDVLFDPNNKCKTSLTKAQFAANFYLAILKSGYDSKNIYSMDQNIAASEFKDKSIHKNLVKLYENVCAEDRFWQGEADLTKKDLLYATTYWFGVSSANKKGLNWKIAHNVRSTTWLDTISFVPSLKDSPQKLEAAYLLADFMLSVPIQEKIHETYGVIVVNKLAKQELKDLSLFYDEDWLWKPLTVRTQGAYQLMHDKLISTLPNKYVDLDISN